MNLSIKVYVKVIALKIFFNLSWKKLVRNESFLKSYTKTTNILGFQKR